MAVPIPTSTSPLPITRRSTSELSAPSAIRMPISRVLRLTLLATSPYKPAMASSNPTAPMVAVMSSASRGPFTAWFRYNSTYELACSNGRFGLSVRTTSFNGWTNSSGSPLARNIKIIRGTGCWASGMYTKSMGFSPVF